MFYSMDRKLISEKVIILSPMFGNSSWLWPHYKLPFPKDVEFIASLRVFPVTFACRSVTTCTASIFAIFASTSEKDQGVHLHFVGRTCSSPKQ